MRRLTIVLSAIAGIMLMAACTSLDCSIDNVVAMNVAVPDTVKSDTLSVYTIVNGADTALYTNGVAVTAVSLPMSYGSDADSYIFAFTPKDGATVADTVTVAKTNTPHFESVDCSPQFWHEIQSVTTTHNVIDSIIINSTHVNNDQTIQHLILRLHSH